MYKSKLFKVRDYIKKHVCILRDNSTSKWKARTTVAASFILDKLIETKIFYTPSDIQVHMLDDHGVKLTWRDKERALKLVRGNRLSDMIN